MSKGIQELRDYVGQVKERQSQRNQNRHTNKCVCTSFNKEQLIVRDLDDPVTSLTYHRNLKRAGKRHCSVKQDPSEMPLHNCALLNTLQLGQPADRANFKEQLEAVIDESNNYFILDTVRALLG